MDELLIEPEPTERELGTAPIKPLFARYAAITFAGMLAQMVMVVLELSLIHIYAHFRQASLRLLRVSS